MVRQAHHEEACPTRDLSTGTLSALTCRGWPLSMPPLTVGTIRKLIQCRKQISMLVLIALVLVVAGTYAVSRWTDARSDGALYAVSESPRVKVGLVLGCSPSLSDGSENLFFKYRMTKAAELFKAGKVEYLLVSGDNSRPDYDEPSAMQNALVELGVPRERIVPDYAGLSTLDSIVRAKEIFGQTQLIVVSQEFHVRRAVCIGQSHGMQVYGVPAADVPDSIVLPTIMREYLARVKMVLDLYILHRNPKYLGEKITIGG